MCLFAKINVQIKKKPYSINSGYFLADRIFHFIEKYTAPPAVNKNLRNPENMNWENKFSSILRETESNLSKARVCKSCCLDIWMQWVICVVFRTIALNLLTRIAFNIFIVYVDAPGHSIFIIFQRKLYTPGHGHLDLTSRGCKYPYCYQYGETRNIYRPIACIVTFFFHVLPVLHVG